MDQNARVARITWVQPRVLDRPQIEALHGRLTGWCEKVKEVGEFVKGQTAPELLGSA
jgi:26S proteasome regulatory subunit N9